MMPLSFLQDVRPKKAFNIHIKMNMVSCLYLPTYQISAFTTTTTTKLWQLC